MEDNILPPGQLIPSDSVSDSLDDTGVNPPVSSYSVGQKNYPLESLEVHTQGGGSASAYVPTMQSVPFSRRRATIVSLAITMLVLLLTGASAFYLIGRDEKQKNASEVAIESQDVSLEGIGPGSLPPELQGEEESLLVNGDIITRGDLRVVSGSFVNVLRTQTLTGDQSVTLPNASGTICLDANNCNFATQEQVAQQGAQLTQQTVELDQVQTELNQIVIPPAGVTDLNGQAGAVAIQGTVNQISVATANGTITLSTPQDLDANANVQFGNLSLAASGQITANALQQTNAGNNISIDANNDAIVFTSGGRVFQFPASGGASQTICTTTVGCGGGGGGGVTDLNGLTGSVTLQGTGDQVSVSTGAGTITFSTPQNINTTSSPTFAALTLTGLGSGNVRVSGGVLTTGAINLATEVTGSLGVGNGGTGITGTPTNGQLLIGNGTNYTLGTLGNNGGLTITNGAGSIGLAVNYGAAANTAVQGNTSLTCPSGTGNLTGGGNSITLGTGGACTSISIVNNPTFSTSVTTPLLTLTGAGNSGTLQVANLGQATAYTLPDPGASSATICLSTGNCAGSGGGVTGSGTNNRVAKFTSTGSTIGDSTISDDGTNVSLTGDLTIQGGDATLGTTLQAGTFAISDGSSNTGSIVTTGLSANQTYTLPNASGDFCLSSGNCIGGGGGGAPNGAQYLVVSLDGTLTNDRAITAGSNIAFTDGGANGNFTVATVQNPTFTTSVTTPLLQSTGAMAITPGGALTVGSASQTTVLQGTTLSLSSNGATNDITLTSADQIILNATGTIELQDNTNITGTLAVTGAVTGGTYNGQTISSAASFTGTLSVATSVTTPSLILTGAGSNGTLQVANLGQTTTFTLPDPGQATASICLSTGNCAGAGTGVTGSGTSGTIPRFTGTQSIGDSIITQSVTTINIAGDLTLSTDLAVAQGGTGASSFTANGVLYGNGGGALQATSAPASGQVLIGNGSGVPTFTTFTGDITVSGAGLTTIQPDSVALGTDTTGNYIATISAGSGIDVTGSGTESATPSISLGPLTANWSQTGAFDVILNNASSELRILESVGGTFYGTLDVADLTADQTITIPNASGAICLTSGNCAGVGGTGDILNGGQAGPITIGTNDATALNLETSGTARLTIASGGDVSLTNNLGVTGNGTFNGTLQVDGNSTLGNAAADSITINGTAVSVPNNLNFDSNTLFIDAANDRVGIGTAAPQTSLHVGSGRIRNDGGILELQGAGGTSFINETGNASYVYSSSTGGSGAFANAGNLILQSRSDADRNIYFVTGDTPSVKMAIAGTSGRVGIGNFNTSLPGADLHLSIGGTSQTAWNLQGVQLRVDSGTYTDTSTAQDGTATNAVFNSFAQPTIAAANTNVTVTNAATVYIANAPAAGTNIAGITNAYALWVDNGAVRFDGNLSVGGNTTLTGDLAVDGGDITSTGTLNINATSTIALQDSTTLTGDFAANTTDFIINNASDAISIGTTATTHIDGDGTVINNVVTIQSTNSKDEIVSVGDNDFNMAADGNMYLTYDANDNSGSAEFAIYTGQAANPGSVEMFQIGNGGNGRIAGDFSVNGGDLTSTGALNVSATGATNDLTLTSPDQIILNAGTASTIALQDAATITGTAGNALTTLTVNNDGSTGSILVLQDNGSAVLTVADGGNITSTGQQLSANGTNALPTYSFSSDPNTGMYRVGADQLGFSTNGVNRLTVGTSNITATVPILIPDGADNIPGLGFSDDADTGIYQEATDKISFTVGGQGRVHIASDGGGGTLQVGTLNGEREIYLIGSQAAEVATENSLEVRLDEDGSNDAFGSFDIKSNAGTESLFSVYEKEKSTATDAGVAYIQGWLRLGVDARTIADDGAGTSPNLSLSPDSSYVEITCNDTNGCTVTMSETGLERGQALTIVNVSANATTIADSSGVIELDNGTTWPGGQWDSLDLIFAAADGSSGRWVELSRSNN